MDYRELMAALEEVLKTATDEVAYVALNSLAREYTVRLLEADEQEEEQE